MPTGEHDLNNTSLRPSSQMILDCIKLKVTHSPLLSPALTCSFTLSLVILTAPGTSLGCFHWAWYPSYMSEFPSWNRTVFHFIIVLSIQTCFYLLALWLLCLFDTDTHTHTKTEFLWVNFYIKNECIVYWDSCITGGWVRWLRSKGCLLPNLKTWAWSTEPT